MHVSAGPTRNDRMDSKAEQNRSGIGAILYLISFAPLVVAGLFGVVLPCQHDFDSYCESNSPMIWVLVGAVVTVLALLLVRYKFFPESVAKEKKKKAAAKRQGAEQAVKTAEQAVKTAEQADKYRLGRSHPANWQSVPKVLCPHCQEKGKVERYVKPVTDGRTGFQRGMSDALNPWSERNLRAERPGYQQVNEELEKLRDEVSAPDMRCKSCTVEWRA